MRPSFVMLLLAALLLIPAAGMRAQGNGTSAAEEAARLVRERKWADAQRVIEPVARAEPKNAAAQYWLGRVRAGQDDVQGARAAFEQAVALAPNVSEYHLWLGNVYGQQAMRSSLFTRLSWARKCKAEFERAVALDPRSVDAHAALAGYYLQAPGIAGGSKEKALAEAQLLKGLQPYAGSFQLARVQLETGKPDAALAELRGLAAAYPDSATPVAVLASTHAGRKEYAPAFAAIDDFLRRHPRDPIALYALGRTAAVSGQRLDDGERALRQDLAGDPVPGVSPGGAHWRLGMIEQARGHTEAARREYETAARLDPRNPEIRKSLDALKP